MLISKWGNILKETQEITNFICIFAVISVYYMHKIINMISSIQKIIGGVLFPVIYGIIGFKIHKTRNSSFLKAFSDAVFAQLEICKCLSYEKANRKKFHYECSLKCLLVLFSCFSFSQAQVQEVIDYAVGAGR